MRFLISVISIISIALSAASATVLTFDEFGDGEFLPGTYGDLVSGTSTNGHSYVIGAEGATPDIFVGFRESMTTRTSGFLATPLAGSGGPMDLVVGFDGGQGGRNAIVELYQFDLAVGAGNEGNVTVMIDGTDGLLFEQTFFVGAAGLVIDFVALTGSPLTGMALNICINGTDLADALQLGIDNIVFGQATPTPLPGAALFMTMGLAALWTRRRAVSA